MSAPHKSYYKKKTEQAIYPRWAPKRMKKEEPKKTKVKIRGITHRYIFGQA